MCKGVLGGYFFSLKPIFFNLRKYQRKSAGEKIKTKMCKGVLGGYFFSLKPIFFNLRKHQRKSVG
ncbi:hypothetical protein, partial [Pedobacter helvus]